MRTRLKTWLHTGERGAAVVEFAITTAAIVLLVMWSHTFYDIIQVRMKNLEASRTALFELTAYPMSAYGKDGTIKQSDHDDLFKKAKDQVEQDIKDLYEKDLDSAQKYKKGGKATKRLTLDTLKLSELKVGDSTALGMTLLNIIQQLMQFQYKSFNTKGFVYTESKAEMTSKFVPTTATFGKRFTKTTLTRNLTQRFYILLDSWKLEDGCNVRAPGNYPATGEVDACPPKNGEESTFHKQVARMAFFGFDTGGFNFLQGGAGSLLGADVLNPFTTRVASINFRDKNDPEWKDGRQILSVDGGEDKFYTAPFCTEQGGGSGGTTCGGVYQEAWDKRGPFFMGCPKEQNDKKELCPWDGQQQGP